MKQRKIAIVSGSHLCHNPRVIKEASTLAAAGFAVTVLGGWFDQELKERDVDLLRSAQFQYSPALDLTGSKSLERFTSRAKTRMGKLVASTLQHENINQLGYFGSALKAELKRCSADLFITHSAVAMAAVASARRDPVRVAVDMEDWFSEELPLDERKGQPVSLIRSLEEKLLPQAVYSSCTSKAMSEALANEFGINDPAVIYNAFPLTDRSCGKHDPKDRKDLRLPSIHWYSQTLGYRRGVEDLIAALPFLKHEAEIHLRGNPAKGFIDIFKRVPDNWRKSIFVHPIVDNKELPKRIAEHDIGFAGELKSSPNRDLTVTNKILQYLVAGLAVVASDTKGHREVADIAAPAVITYSEGNPASLAEQLDVLLASSEKLAALRAAAVASSERVFCWEQQESKLLNLVETALARN